MFGVFGENLAVSCLRAAASLVDWNSGPTTSHVQFQESMQDILLSSEVGLPALKP